MSLMRMQKIHTSLFFLTLLSLLGFEYPVSNLYAPNPEILGTGSHRWIEKEIAILRGQSNNIDRNVLRLSLNAYVHAREEGLDTKQLLTIIDFTKPSSEKRLWVFDIKHGKAVLNTWVSHGKNSGALKAQSFSNNPGSLKSSIGVFVTDDNPYLGEHGYSLRIYGLEKGFNDNAFRRDIVIHGAWYVNTDIIKKYGAIGRSFGCPAVSNNMVKSLIDTIKQKTVIFAYYPDKNWLSHSRFLMA